VVGIHINFCKWQLCKEEMNLRLSNRNDLKKCFRLEMSEAWLWKAVFLLLVNFRQISIWKYDFTLYKGFCMEKIIQIRQILKIIFCKLSNFYDKFQQVANNIEGFSFFFTLISSMQPNLATLFCEWLLLWLHHEIIKRNPGEKRRSTELFWTEEILGEVHGILLFQCSGLINAYLVL
jgi:hypothetical protein